MEINYNFGCFLLVLFISGSILSYSSALRIAVMDVPSPVAAGEAIELTCSYDLEGDVLYSVKYYKNGYEFYRYVPSDWPPAQFFSMPGIRVDISRSDRNKVYLKYVDLSSAGTYRCEISAEAPSFNTAAAEKEMQIFVLPSKGPEVWSDKTEGNPGDNVTVTCISAKSKPAAKLNWYLNGKEMGTDREVEYTTTSHKDGLESSTLKMRFPIQEEDFSSSGSMKLKCISSFNDVYLMKKENQLDIHYKEMKEKLLSLRLREDLVQARSSSSSGPFTSPSSLLSTYRMLGLFLSLHLGVKAFFSPS